MLRVAGRVAFASVRAACECGQERVSQSGGGPRLRLENPGFSLLCETRSNTTSPRLLSSGLDPRGSGGKAVGSTCPQASTQAAIRRSVYGCGEVVLRRA